MATNKEILLWGIKHFLLAKSNCRKTVFITKETPLYKNLLDVAKKVKEDDPKAVEFTDRCMCINYSRLIKKGQTA